MTYRFFSKNCLSLLVFTFLMNLTSLSMETKDDLIILKEKSTNGLHEISTREDYSVFTQSPEGFNPKFEAVGCFFEYDNKVLLLKRVPNTTEANKWGIPGGKMAKDESPRSAIIRETLEETGLGIDNDTLKEMGTNYIRLSKMDFIFHMFRIPLMKQPDILLSATEHTEAKWLTVSEALSLPLITGEIESFVQYRKIK